jgi:hypothetical protein
MVLVACLWLFGVEWVSRVLRDPFEFQRRAVVLVWLVGLLGLVKVSLLG